MGLNDSADLRPVLVVLAAGEDVTEQLGELPRASWGPLLQQSSLHRMETLFAEQALRVPTIPPENHRLLTMLLDGARVSDRIRAERYREVVMALTDGGVDAVAVKGFVLSQTVYPRPELRPYNDLDVLIPARDADRAVEVMRAAGFVQGSLDPRTQTVEEFSAARLEGYRTELQHLADFVAVGPFGRSLAVDIHTRFHTAFDHMAPAAELMLERAVEDPVIGCRRLAPADAVVHLAYHAWWDTQSIEKVRRLLDLRLSHLADTSRSFATYELDCSDVLRSAEELHCLPATHWFLWLTHTVLGTLHGASQIDETLARQVDATMADRWLQRDTSEAMLTWAAPGPERMFQMDRDREVLGQVWSQYFQPRLNAGDVMSWTVRG